MESSEQEQFQAWLRVELEASGEPLGRGYQASIELYEGPFGRFAVKRARGAAFLRRVREAAIRREHAVYERLTNVPGVPKCMGLIDGKYLVLEHLSGDTFRRQEHAIADREKFFQKLLVTVRAMHAAGVAHGDLKRKDNILVDADQRPYVVDFGTAFLRRNSNRGWNRAIFDWLSQSDYNAWIKLKYQRRIDEISPADRGVYRPLFLERLARVVRILWQKVTLRRLRVRLRTKNRR